MRGLIDVMCASLFRRATALFAVLTAVLTALFLRGMPEDSFLFIHDEFLPFPGSEMAGQFVIRKFRDFGSSETFQLAVTAWDRLYFHLAYGNGLGLRQAQILLYVLKLFFIMFLPYVGFVRLARSYKADTSEIILLAASLWYSFNTYTVIFWHGNAFSLTLVLCYALAPLALYFWERALVSQEVRGGRFFNFIVLALLLFIMSFALYLFAAFVLFLCFYTVVRAVLLKMRLRDFIVRSAGAAVACAPLFIAHLMVLYEMFFLSSGAQNVVGGETNGMLQGGLLSMSLMWLTWPMYIVWFPRNIWTFTAHYHAPLVLAAPFILYGQILWGTWRRRGDSVIWMFALLALVFIFLAKGPQPPFGELYSALLAYVPGFRVFRSPDTKFGFMIVFCVATLLSLAGSAVSRRKGLFAGLIMLAAGLQSWPLLTGLAIQGENTSHSRDRVISFHEDHRGIAAYLNDPSRLPGYVMTLPAVEFGRYRFGKEEHSGQDLLPKLVSLPFVYTNESSCMAQATHDALAEILAAEDFGRLGAFSIRYYIVRRDVKGEEDGPSVFARFLDKSHKKAYENPLFTIYEDSRAAPLVEGGAFRLINPTQVEVTVPRAGGEVLFHQSPHPAWRVYEDMPVSKNPGSWFRTISFLWRSPVSGAPSRALPGINGWSLSDLNLHGEDGPIRLTLFYWPQAVFNLLATVSLGFAGFYAVFAGTLLLFKQRVP